MTSIGKYAMYHLYAWGFVALLLCGCETSVPSGSVSGKVTLDGEPVTAGEISFTSSDGYGGSANIGSDGSFTVEGGMPVGNYKVTIGPPALTEAPGEEGGNAATAPTDFPGTYSDPSMSDLSAEVVAGENSLTLDMKASGPGS